MQAAETLPVEGLSLQHWDLCCIAWHGPQVRLGEKFKASKVSVSAHLGVERVLQELPKAGRARTRRGGGRMHHGAGCKQGHGSNAMAGTRCGLCLYCSTWPSPAPTRGRPTSHR